MCCRLASQPHNATHPTMLRSSLCLFKASARILPSTRLTSTTGRRRKTSSGSIPAQSPCAGLSPTSAALRRWRPLAAVRLDAEDPGVSGAAMDDSVLILLGTGEREYCARRDGPASGVGLSTPADAAVCLRGVVIADMAGWVGLSNTNSGGRVVGWWVVLGGIT